jgi:hypothetical protein
MEQNRSVRNCALKTCAAPNGFDNRKYARNAYSLIHAEIARLACNQPLAVLHVAIGVAEMAVEDYPLGHH